MDTPEARFAAERRRLVGIAYRMLGDASEAEDVVQEAWLRFSSASAPIDNEAAWLAQVVVRLCLDVLKSARARRERYVGPWLPEPVPTEAVEEGVDPSTISVAFLLLLEKLSPLERAAFLLHEVFDYSHAEVAAALGRDEAAARQLAHRAREHLKGRPRFAPSKEKQVALLGRFLQACAAGDLAGLERLLTDDARVVSDGGGVARAARKVVHGRDRCARLIVGLVRKGSAEGLVPELRDLNGAPAILFRRDGAPNLVLSVELDGDRIAEVHWLLNPEKLRAFD